MISVSTSVRSEWEAFVAERRSHFLTDGETMTEEEKWRSTLDKVKTFMDERGRRPISTSKEKQEKVLGSWICTQLTNYSPDVEQCKYIMKSASVRSEWEAFVAERRGHFLTAEEVWRSTLVKVKAFMDENGKRPSSMSKEKQEKVLGSWICNQLANYSPDAEQCKNIMKSESVRSKWETFVAERRSHFLSGEEAWRSTLDKVKAFMVEKGKRPKQKSKETQEKVLGIWISAQLRNYSPDAEQCKHIMRLASVRSEWETFVAERRSQFLTKEEIWRSTLAKVRVFMEEKGRRPSQKSKDEQEKILGRWINNQIANYSSSSQGNTS
jgi:predicted small secreted protein